jgi:putative aldouronate transport system substrate-binding protein
MPGIMRHPAREDELRARTFVAACIAIALLLPSVVSASGAPEGLGPRMTITWLARGSLDPSWVDGEKSWFIQQLEDRFSVDIRLNGIDSNDGDKVTAMLAAGEFPDCGNPWVDPYQGYGQGLSRAIPEEMVRFYAPNYSRVMERDYPIGWLMYRNRANPQEFLSIQGIATSTDCGLWFLGFRADWAAKVGMPVPNFKEKRIPADRSGKMYFLDQDVSLDWVEKLLIAFRDKDPDGNGRNDTIPWGASRYFGWTWNAITGCFGFAEGYNVSDGGTLFSWAVYPGYRDFLALAARWYRAGLVDRDFVNLDLVPAWQKVESQRIGVSTVQLSYVDQEYAARRPPNTIVPDGDLQKGAAGVILVPPVGKTGKQGSRAYGINPVGYPFLINRTVDDAKCARILAILDWMRFGAEEPFVWALYGKSSVHFDWQGEPWSSPVVPRKADRVPAGYPKAGGFPSAYPPGYTRDRNRYAVTGKLLSIYTGWLFSDRGQSLTIRPYRADVLGETRYAELDRRYGAALTAIVNDYQLKVITGQLDVTSTWDAYVATWRRSGGDELMAEMAKAPILSELRKGRKAY